MNNKTLASVVKEAREKINISQRELSSSVLNLSLEMLMELCEYSKEEIDSTVNNSYSSMVIKPENAPILVLDDIVNQMQDELYMKMVIKELLDNCDLEELNFISELNKKDKTRVIKVIKNYVRDNEKEIKKQKQSLDDLKKLLTEEE